MGAYTRDTGSSVRLAQRDFDQGMVLAWGFNPAEAARSFTAATRADPECALCWSGLAWSLGPTINAEMAASDAPRVRAALERALALAPRSRAPDRALIGALAIGHPRGSAGRLDETRYARAMLDAARRHPRDADLQALAAGALLTLRPHDCGGPRAGRRPGRRGSRACSPRRSRSIRGTPARTTTSCTSWNPRARARSRRKALAQEAREADAAYRAA